MAVQMREYCAPLLRGLTPFSWPDFAGAVFRADGSDRPWGHRRTLPRHARGGHGAAAGLAGGGPGPATGALPGHALAPPAAVQGARLIRGRAWPSAGKPEVDGANPETWPLGQAVSTHAVETDADGLAKASVRTIRPSTAGSSASPARNLFSWKSPRISNSSCPVARASCFQLSPN